MMQYDTIVNMVACFRCGTIAPPFEVDSEHGVQLCKCCGERGVVTFRQALDIINENFLEKHLDVDSLTQTGYFDD